MELKISDVVKILPFDDVITLDMVSRKNDMIGQYIITESLIKSFEQILVALLELQKSMKKSFLVEGAYGVGKSHFLLFSSFLVESSTNQDTHDMIKKKISGTLLSPSFQDYIVKKSKIMLIRIDLKEFSRMPLDQILLNSYKKTAKQYLGIDFSFRHEIVEIMDILNRWKDNNIENYKKFFSYCQDQGTSQERFFDGLNRYDERIVKLFEEGHLNVVGSRVNLLPLNIYKATEEFIQFITSEGYNGLALFIDEITTFLESISDPNRITAEINTIERLSELTQVSPLLIIGTILRREIPLSGVSTSRWEKATDRFEHLPITLINLGEMLKSKLEVVNEKAIQSALTQSDTSGFFMGNRIELLSILDYYPLHPYTIRILEQASGLFSQTRSVFSFVSHIGSHIIQNERLIVDNSLKFITPDNVFDYFEEDFTKKNPESISVIQSIINSTNDLLKESIVKTVGLGSVLSPILPISIDFLEKTYLNETTEDKLKEILQDFSHYFLSRGDGYVIVSATSSKNIRVLNQRENEILQINYHKLFTKFIRKYLSSQKPVEFQGIQWPVQINCLTVNEFEENKPKFTSDSLNFYLVIREGRKTINEALFRSSTPNSNIFVSFSFNNLDRKKVARYLAANQLLDEADLSPEEREYYVSQVANLDFAKLIETSLSMSSLKVFTSKGSFSYSKRIIEVKTVQRGFALDLSLVFIKQVKDTVLSFLYPSLAVLEIKSSVSKRQAPITNMVERFLIHHQEKLSNVIKDRIKSILVPLGFAKKRNEKYVAVEPEKGIQYEIYENVLESISGSTRCQDLFIFLNNPPYGFSEVLFEIYIAALIRLGKITLYKNRHIYTLNSGTDAHKIGKNPNQFSIRISKTIDPKKWRLLLQIWELFDRDATRFGKYDVLPSDMYSQVKEELIEDIFRGGKSITRVIDKFTEIEKSKLPLELEQLKLFISNLKSQQFEEPTEGLENIVNVLSEICETENIDEIWVKFRAYFETYKKIEEFIDDHSKNVIKLNKFLKTIDLPKDDKDLISRMNQLKSDYQDLLKKISPPNNLISALYDSFSKFRSDYNDKYVKEHLFLASTLENFLVEFDELAEFKLLGLLQDIDKTILPEPKENLARVVKGIREKQCSIDPTSFLDVSPTCRCDYKLGEFVKNTKELETDKNRILTQLRKDLSASLVKFQEKLPKNIEAALGVLCREKPELFINLVREIPMLIESAKELSTLPVTDMNAEISKTKSIKLNADVKKHAEILKKLVSPPESQPDPTTEIAIDDLFNHIRKNIRVMKIRPPHKELKDVFEKFLNEHKDDIIKLK